MAYKELKNSDMDELGKLLLEDNFHSLCEVVENKTHASRIFCHLAKEFVSE